MSRGVEWAGCITGAQRGSLAPTSIWGLRCSLSGGTFGAGEPQCHGAEMLMSLDAQSAPLARRQLHWLLAPNLFISGDGKVSWPCLSLEVLGSRGDSDLSLGSGFLHEPHWATSLARSSCTSTCSASPCHCSPFILPLPGSPCTCQALGQKGVSASSPSPPGSLTFSASLWEPLVLSWW